MPNLVGILELASKYKFGLTARGAPLYLFRPFHCGAEASCAYVVGCSERDTSRNQLAVVEVPSPSPAEGTAGATGAATTKIRGNLIRLLGPVGDYAAERAALLHHYAGPPPPSRSPSRSVTEPEPESDADATNDALRMEFSARSGWITFHIDPAGCRDIDDAIAWNPKTGEWAIVIADVAAGVTPGSVTDRKAYALGSTFYDTDGRVVRPMLPPTISEGSASLLPGERRRGVALLCGGDGDGDRWVLCWITVTHSFTYETFFASVGGGGGGEAAELLRVIDPATDMHEWIATQMIRYNTAAGRLLKARGVGLLRTQKASGAAEGLDDWPLEFRHLTDQRAVYEPVCRDTEEQGHAGLQVTAYAHASSPLRRYADLLNQRLLVECIVDGGSGSGAGGSGSVTESSATEGTPLHSVAETDVTTGHCTPLHSVAETGVTTGHCTPLHSVAETGVTTGHCTPLHSVAETDVTTGHCTPLHSVAEHLNERSAMERRWSRELLFLEQVTPGRVHEVEVVLLQKGSDENGALTWVPAWNRMLRLRHEIAPTIHPGDRFRIGIFCDPTKPTPWRQRILTAPAAA